MFGYISLIAKTRNVNLILFTIFIMYPLVGMGIDLIAPSLPAISHQLNISQTVVKNLIGIYLFGYALGNFAFGFLSDTYGRRKLVILGIAFFVIISLFPIWFHNAIVLLLVRFFQGFSIAAFAVIARAICSDILTAKKLLRMATMLALTWGIGPIIGPVIGGYLQYYFDWPACFYFFAIYALIGLFAIILLIPETIQKRQKWRFSQIKENVVTIFTHRIFMAMVSIMGISYSILIVFNILGPFLIQKTMGHSSIYFGHIAFFMGIAFITGTILCRVLLNTFTAEKIIAWSLLLFLIIAAVGLWVSYLEPKNIWVISVFTLLLFFGNGVTYPACMGTALTHFRNLAGSSSAVMNLINILITSISAFLVSFVFATDFIRIAWIFLALSLLRSMVYWLFLARIKDPGS